MQPEITEKGGIRAAGTERLRLAKPGNGHDESEIHKISENGACLRLNSVNKPAASVNNTVPACRTKRPPGSHGYVFAGN